MRIKHILLITFLFSSVALAHDFKALPPSQQTQKLIKELNQELPDNLKITLNNKITFDLFDSTPLDFSSNNICSIQINNLFQDNFFDSSKIRINRMLVSEIEKGNRSLNCIHSNLYQLFKSNLASILIQKYDEKAHISSSPLFLNVAGWISKGIIIKRRTNLNQHEARSPNTQEFISAKKSLAINFEFFLYDPNYKCRRPSYYQFYSKLFSIYPFKEYSCHPSTKILMTGNESKDGTVSSQIKELNFDRLYQIHYLFAGKGDAPMSRFGHAMYRLVFCAPEKPKGPNCLNDVSHHIVLSFRANIQDLKMSYMKGIQGEYPSQLFFLNLADVVDEYTKGEFRELTSIPLKLTDEQAKKFLERTTELYWSYKGKYYFFTNNCATEAMNLIRIALGEKDNVQTRNIITPNGLYRYFRNINIADTTLLQDLKSAQAKGLYFPPVTEKILKSFSILNFKEDDIETFLKESSAEYRMNLYQKAFEQGENKILLAANALKIEELVLQSKEIAFTKELGIQLFSSDPDPKISSSRLGNIITEIQKLYTEITPEQYLTNGYGIPLTTEFRDIPENKIYEVNSKIKSYMAELQSLSNELFPEQTNEIRKTNENRTEILRVMAK